MSNQLRCYQQKNAARIVTASSIDSMPVAAFRLSQQANAVCALWQRDQIQSYEALAKAYLVT